MNELRMKRLFEVLCAQLEDGVVEMLLELAADYEYRMCLLELGVTL